MLLNSCAAKQRAATLWRSSTLHLSEACRTPAQRTWPALSSTAIPRCRFINTPAYEGHIPLNWFETALLTVGSAVVSLTDPRRGGECRLNVLSFLNTMGASDMVAALGETTAGPSLSLLRDRMLESAEGRRILKGRPRVNSTTVDMNELAHYPEGSFGRAYVTWLERCGVTPDTREPVSTSVPYRREPSHFASRSITSTIRNWPT